MANIPTTAFFKPCVGGFASGRGAGALKRLGPDQPPTALPAAAEFYQLQMHQLFANLGGLIKIAIPSLYL